MVWQEFFRKVSDSPPKKEIDTKEDISKSSPIVLQPIAIYFSDRTGWICIGNTPSAGNPEARAANDRAISSARMGKFIQAAEEFSTASASEPKIPGYVVNVQEALFGEISKNFINLS
ncbi:MAG: hypothetical protein M1575_04005 [Patescibacteria group bacterium]|nr:hypothetical protein [Patescibacteria group bacterium]MCL5095854.1 hypothetical protein [Patescibacteria group bacterium]